MANLAPDCENVVIGEKSPAIGGLSGGSLKGLQQVCDPLANLISGFIIAMIAPQYGLR